MANKKKKENTLQYLQMPLPSGGKYSRMTKVNFGGLNKRYTIDSGHLSMESNISTNAYPYLSPSECRDEINYYYDLPQYEHPISMSAFDDFLFVRYWEDYIVDDGDDEVHIKLDYLTEYEGEYRRYTGLVKTFKSKDFDPVKDTDPRSIVQFNVYIQSIDIVNGQYEKKYLIFPDKASLDTNILEASRNIEKWTDEEKKNVSYSALYYDVTEDVYFNISKDDEGKLTTNLNGKKGTKDENGETVVKGYFVLNGMSVDIVEYKNDVPMKDKDGEVVTDESGKPLYPPPDSASHRHYYKNTYVFTKPDGTTYTDTNIYRWVDDEVDSENSGWKISMPPTMPDIKYATVHVSRLFGLSDDCVYASGFNDYTNWALDTASEYNESNAWQSKAQSNTKADGNFTGITTFQGHVICFKRDFMHEIYNTKNPFRIQDVYAEGTIDNRTIQDVDGKLIFVSEDDVKVYTGSNPRVIGYNLNMSKYTYAVSGTDNRNYYLYCKDGKKQYLYVYDTYTDLWSEQEIDSVVLSFAHNKNGMYMLCKNGAIYQMDTGSYTHDWSFETELITSQTVDIKHIKKLQMFVEHKSNADMQVYILYDNEEFDKMDETELAKRLVYDTKSKGKSGKYPIRVKPRKTANYGFKLHVKGFGYVKLYELEIFVEQGGDMYV